MNNFGSGMMEICSDCSGRSFAGIEDHHMAMLKRKYNAKVWRNEKKKKKSQAEWKRSSCAHRAKSKRLEDTTKNTLDHRRAR